MPALKFIAVILFAVLLLGACDAAPGSHASHGDFVACEGFHNYNSGQDPNGTWHIGADERGATTQALRQDLTYMQTAMSFHPSDMNSDGAAISAQCASEGLPS